MNVRIPGLIVLAALAGAAACKDNPTSSGSGTPTQVIANFASLNLNGVGATGTFTAYIVDSRLTPLPGQITFSTCDATTATIANDGSYQPVPATSMRAIVTATGLNKTCLIASASGVKADTVMVTVFPVTFPGTLSGPANPKPSTIAVLKTGVPTLQFDTSKVAVSFGQEKIRALLLSKSPDSLVLAIPQFSRDSLRVAGVVVTYSGQTVSLAGAPITAGTDVFTGDSSWAIAFDLTSSLPASGSSITIYPAELIKANPVHCPEAVAFGPPSVGPCLIFKMTFAAPTTLNITTSWPSPGGAVGGKNPDIDIYTCSDTVSAGWKVFLGGTCPAEDNGNASTTANPETTGNVTYPAGTRWLVLDYSAACDASPASSCTGNGVVSNFTLKIAKQ